MIKKTLSEDEIQFCEAFFNPKMMLECLYPKGAMQTWNEEGECLTVRNYQIPLLQYDSVIEDDDKLTEGENFQRRIDVGTLFVILGRKLGKSFIALIGNMILKLIYYSGREMTLAAYDEKHMGKIMDKMRSFYSSHEFFRQYKKSIKGAPEYTLETLNGNALYGINETVKGKDPGCVDKETEILTDSGWKYFNDLTYKDKVLSLNKEGVADYYKINKLIKSKYKGILKRFKSNTSEFLFTPNHKIVVLEHEILKLKQLDKDSFYKQIYMKPNFIWKGNNIKEIKFAGISNSKKIEFSIEIKIWCKFIAWYLGEGSLAESVSSHYRVIISQKKNCLELENLLDKMKIKYSKHIVKSGTFNYTISNKLIYKHLLKYFGKAKNKHIATYFKNLSSDLLNIFIEEYLLGDGTVKYHKNRKLPYRGLCTSVKVLADDLQEVSLKAGYKTNLLIDRIRENSFSKKEIYWITLCHDKTTVFTRDKIETIFYDGYVYCVDVEPNHTILIRRNGHVVWTGNSNWWGHHTDINFQDEIQAESDVAYSKKIDAIGEMGCIEVLCGIPLVTKVSPLGKILKDRTKQKNILRFPQYISTYWNQKVREERERQYGGINTIGYKVNVEAELIEGAEGAFDMQRVRDNYDPNKIIKAFEITKENYSQFFNILILDSYANAEKIFIFADIGDTAATEIGIAFKVNNKYHLVYNITAFRLSDKELSTLLIWIFKKVNADFISVDCTVMGKPIYRQLSEVLDIVKDGKVIKRVIWCAFNESVTVGYEKDDNGNIMLDGNGLPVERRENTIIFAVQKLREMFYDKLFVIPDNFIKFDEEMSSYLQLVSGNKVIFDSTTDDHVVQMMQVLAILIWQTEQLPAININMKPKKTSLGIFSNEGD